MKTKAICKGTEKRKRLLFGVLVILVLGTVLFLTFQGPKETTQLSGGFQAWLFMTFGWDIEMHTLRSNIHFVEYFGVGLTLALFARSMEWKRWAVWALIAGCAFGLLDETIKIFLPTREFDGIDFIKDCIGIAAAVGTVYVFNNCLRGGNITNRGK